MRKVRLWLAFVAALLATSAGAQSNLTVTAAEYFFDSDPGYGQATVINNVVGDELEIAISTSDLSVGAHSLCLRTLGSNGVWSTTMTKTIYVMHAGSNINSVEYFFDNDPGYGKGTVLALGGAKDVTLDINTVDITPGAHMLYLRTQDTNGNWSPVMAHSLYVFTVLPVAALEYFVDDNDPGEGKAISVPVATATAASAVFDIDTSELTPGEHTLNIRAMGIDSVWTAVSTRKFNVEGPVVSEPEPYVVLSTNDTVIDEYEGNPIYGSTMTFYYDDQRSARQGMPMGEGGSSTWINYAAGITSVVFDPSFAGYRPVTTSSWFNKCQNLTAITGIEYLKTDSVKNMSFMFAECEKLETLDVSGFNTENVTTMLALFQNCKRLTTLDVGGFNTAKVTNFAQMFNGCSGLASIDVTHFVTSNATSMNSMFSDCSGLTSLDVRGFNTANVTMTSSMFYGCSGLTSLDVSNFDVQNAKDMRSMFYGCSGLTSLDLSNFYTTNAERINFMFSGCTSLTTIDISNMTTANVLHMNNMFYNCSSLTTIYADDFDLTKMEASSSMFYGCTLLVGGKGTKFDASHIDHAYAHVDGGTTNPGYFTDKNATPIIAEAYAVLSDNNTVLTFYYDTEKQTRGGMGVGPFSTIDDREWNYETSYISKVVFDESFANDTTITSTANWFAGMDNMTAIEGLQYLNSQNVTSTYYMFWNCSSLTSLDLSKFSMQNVTNMDGMFSLCSGLTALDLRNANAQKVTDMGHMFDGCTNLVSVLFGDSFNTAALTNMYAMFQNCSSLRDIDLSNFNTNNVTIMGSVFNGCSSLVSIDISGFSTNKVIEIGGMFRACTSLASIQAGYAAIPAEEYARIDNPNLLVYVNEPSLAPQGVQNVVVNGVAREIVLTDEVGSSDNNNFFVPQSFAAEKITYIRNFAQETQPNVSRGWESISLPFNVQNIAHETKGNLSPFGSSAGGKKFWLRRLSDKGLMRASQIEANVPYVISMPNSTEYTDLYNLAGRVTFSAENTTVPTTTQQTMSLSDGSIDMVPTMLRVSRSSSVWALNVGEVRGQYLEGSVFERDYRMVRPFQAYTVHHSDSPAPRFVPINTLMDGEATSIDELMSPKTTADTYYTLDGRKLDSKPVMKGIYIHNGRKVVVE
jgi:surface protein